MPAELKTILYNLGYFLGEVKTSIRLNFLTNLFSAVSIGLILFILAAVMSGWWISKDFIEIMNREAEISVFWDEGLAEHEIMGLAEQIGHLDGVREVRIVGEDEAYDRMAELLGQEAGILDIFEINPFTPYLEVNLVLDQRETVLAKLNQLPAIEHVRDNQEVLNRLEGIVQVLGIIGYLGLAAVSLATLIIIAHIIKLSIHSKKSQIQTLELLGASKSFIAFPFLMEGILIAFTGGILATVLIVPSVKLVYLQLLDLLPFLPLPGPEKLTLKVTVLLWVLSIIFGFAGGLVGLSSTKR